MFWLIYVTMNIENVLLWLECSHGDVCATNQCHRQQAVGVATQYATPLSSPWAPKRLVRRRADVT